jgi:ribonuclease R
MKEEYMSNFEKRILDFLKSEPLHTYKAREIARRLKVKEADYRQLRATLRALVRDGQILRLQKNRFGLGQAAVEAVGKLHVNSQGYGFVIRDDGEDIFVSQKNMGAALHHDIVRVRLFATYQGKSPEGRIVDVVERTRPKIVGTFRKGKKHNFVIPDDIKRQRDIIVANGDQRGAQDGQKVVAVIDLWEDAQLSPSGHIENILGFPDEPGVDVLSVAHEMGLPGGFDHKVLAKAQKLRFDLSDEESKRRLDLRHLVAFTIDPPDAKDFDDAVSLEILDNGHYHLGVHIADVSHFVKQGSVIDREALERGTSVYLVDRVVPMLPEKLSNELCSLREGEDKFCHSVLMELDPHGELLSFDIKETIIKSAKRFSYREAQDIIEGKQAGNFRPVLLSMHRLYRLLYKIRQQRGSVNFDSLEVEVELDAQGTPIQLHRRERLDTHGMIEEFMLLANETVTKHVAVVLSQQRETPLPFVYRVHQKPDKESIDELVQLCRAFGVQVTPPKRITPKYFQHLSRQFQAHPAATVLQDALLRSMMKAKYSIDNIGHFGLAYKHYTHFTSPIRRYPDLIVHRLLKRYNSSNGQKTTLPGFKKLEEICRQCSEREVRALEAERASVKMKQVEYMEKHLGDVFDGVISRIVPFGIFVQLPDFLIDGLVHVTSLGDDYYVLDEKKYTMRGSYSGKVFKLGDPLRVKISKVSRNERLVDFVLE